MMWDLQVNMWSVNISYCRSEGRLAGAKATCTRKMEYMIATITIDPNMAHDEEDVLRSLRHELLHLVLAPFDLYMQTMFQAVTGDAALERIESKQWDHAVESAVVSLERMLDHGLQWRSRRAPEPDAKPVSPHTPE